MHSSFGSRTLSCPGSVFITMEHHRISHGARNTQKLHAFDSVIAKATEVMNHPDCCPTLAEEIPKMLEVANAGAAIIRKARGSDRRERKKRAIAKAKALNAPDQSEPVTEPTDGVNAEPTDGSDAGVFDVAKVTEVLILLDVLKNPFHTTQLKRELMAKIENDLEAIFHTTHAKRQKTESSSSTVKTE